MSTYANITINGDEFCVRSNGGDRRSIADSIRGYVKEIRGKIKPDYLATAVLNAITADGATDYYAPFQVGFCEFPSYIWRIELGKRGGVKIRGGRR